MSIGAIEAGRAFVRLLVNDTELQKGLTRAQTKLKMFAASTGQLGRQLMTLTGPIIGLGAAGAKAFADFEQQMAQVSTMLDDPGKFMGPFTEGIKNLSVEFGEATETLAGGLYEILSASIEPAKAMDVLRASVMAAKAGLSDTATATSAIVTIMNAYGMRADQAGQISDWLFQVVKRGQSTFAELAPSIGNVATIAATAGVSLNELGAIFSTITRAGVKTDEAITAITAIISTFLDPSDEAAEIAKDLGINLSASALQSEGLLEVFKKLGNLPPDVLAKLFPNIRALKGALPALRNLEGFEEDMAALGDAAGSTEEAYKKLADTLAHKFNQVKRAIILAVAEIGAALKVDLAEGAEVIRKIGTHTAEWIQKHQTLISVLGKSAVVVGAVAGALMALSVTASAAGAALGGLALASKAASASLTFLLAHPAVAVLAGIAVVTVALGAAMDAAASETLRLADAQQGLLDKGDKERKQAVDALKRLQSLSEKQKLSNEEKEEGARIIERLEARYGDLGLAMDDTTGKITGVAGAFDLLTAAMQKSAEAEIRAAMLEASTNVEILSEEINRVRDAWMTPWGKAELLSDLVVQMEQADAKAKALLYRLQKMQAGDLEAALGGEEPGTPKTGPTVDPLAAVQREKKAAEDAAKFKKDLDERMHEAKLAMIEDEYRRDLEAIKAKHMAERAEAKKAGRDMAALQEVQLAEVNVVHAEHRKKQAEEQKRAEEEKARNQKDLQEEIEELTIKTQTKGLDQQLKLLELERRRALVAAPISGEPIAAINRKFDLMAQLAKTEGAGDIMNRVSVSGTFSAQQAARMGASSIEEKQLRAQEHIGRVAERIDRNTSNLGRLGP